VEGDGKEKIKGVGFPIMLQPCRHPFREKRSEAGLSFIFPTMDCLPERSFIGSQSPCHCKIFFVG
jgi:hypothetical protein